MKRTTIGSVVTVMAALVLGACDDGASCDMDPDQPDCPEDDGYGGGGGYYPDPTPTPAPSQGVRILGVNGSVYSGETVFVAVKMQYAIPDEPIAFCGAALVGTAGDFSIPFDGPALRPGYAYSVDVLADLDGSGGLTTGEPRWYATFTTPTATSVTSSDVAFDFATAYFGSYAYWGEAACAP